MFSSPLILVICFLVLAIIVVVAFGAGTENVILALGIAFIPRYIRLSRANTLSAAEQVFVEASRATGQSNTKIIFKHILPNIAGDIIVMSTLWIATAIRLEASLSFLGLGTQPPTPSWGMMIREGMEDDWRLDWLVENVVRPWYQRVQGVYEEARALDLAPSMEFPHFFYILIGAASLIFSQAPEVRRVAGLNPQEESVVAAHADALAELLFPSDRIAAESADRTPGEET